MKKYLNNKEVESLLFIFHLIDVSRTVVDDWISRGNMTSNEAKWIRTAVTLLMKAVKSILDRLDNKDREKFIRRTIKAQNEPVRIVDKWMHDRILGTYDTEYEIVKVERPEFEKLTMACIQSHCEDCNDIFSECDIYDIFENNLVPRAEIKHNCPYSFHSKKRIEEIKLMKAEIEEKRKNKKISKRKQKKIKNRFDEE